MNKKVSIGISSSLMGAIIAMVMAIEGGFVNHPDDPGGATKYGITEQTARDFGYQGEMKDLPKETAFKIYEVLYVIQPHFDELIEINPAIAHKMIDAGINVGTSRVSIWFQRALNSYSRGGLDYPLIDEDGVIGPATLNAYRSLEKVRGKVQACTLMLKALDGYQASYYLSLTQYNMFLSGWMDKRIENVPLNQCKEYNLAFPFIKNENK